MNTKEEILAKLRAGEDFGKIRTEMHSISKLYEAARQYLDELQARLESIQAEINRGKEENANLEAQIASLGCESESLREKNQRLEQENARLNRELSEKSAKLSSLEERIGEFRAQGFTPEIMRKLEPKIAKGGDLLLMAETAEKRDQVKKDLACARKSKADLLKDIKTLRREKRTRALTELRKRKDLTVLNEKVTRKRKEYAELARRVEDAEGAMAILRDVTLKSINEAQDAATNAIHSTARASAEAFAAACEKFSGDLQAFLQSFGVLAEEKIGWIEEQHRQRRETDQQKTLFERALAYGRFMQGLFESDEFLLTVSLPWMLQLAHRLRLWLREKLPMGAVFPSDSVLQRQFGLTKFQSYNLAALTELVCEGLEAASSKERIQLDGAKAGANSSQG